MRRDALGRNNQPDKILGNILGFDGAESQLFERGFVQDAPNDINQSGSRSEIPSIGTQVNAAQHDFLCTGIDQLAHFVHHHIRRQAAAAAADERNHAVGAAVVASILNFQNGPRAIAGQAIVRSNLDGSLRKNISREYLGRPSLERHGIRVERREGDEIGRSRRLLPSKITQQSRNFALMRIPYDPSDTVERGDFVRRALRVAAGHYDSCFRI